MTVVLGLLALAVVALPALADTPSAADASHHHMDAMPAEAHAHQFVAPKLFRTVTQYATPDVQLVRDDGRSVNLRAEIDDGRPVVLAFIYTSCSAVCPLTTQTLSALQSRLGADRDRVHLVSISIDPEQDTPARLRDYAQRFHAGPEWHYYTGSLGATQLAQRAFDVYRGDKMSHSPVTLVRAAPGAPWVRLDGFATADELYAELPHPLLTANR
jgi:protein SCO1/2